ncbi:MAG: protein kinase, partial [bacterium]
LNHPNIATIYEIDEADGQTRQEPGMMFIAMEYIEGQSLQDLVGAENFQPLPIDGVIIYALQIAEGLQAAHKKGIVHRDIKPANILVTEDGMVKIVDFGLAKLAGHTQLTKEGTSMGTVAYMSPEQTHGVEVDHRTDIWALGAVLYQMISGKQPFGGDYEQALMYSIMNEDPEPLTSLRTGVPMELERIINKCLEKEPNKRYQHTDDLLVDLRRLKESSDSKNQTISKQKTKTQKRRVSLGIALLTVIAFLILGYLFWSPASKKPEEERKKIAVLPFENLGPAEDEYFAAGMTDEITSRLASVRALGIISRNSAIQYAKTEKTTKQIGTELGVDYVIEGSVRWARPENAGNKVRITPQLIRVSDETNLWTKSYDRIIDDIFAIQSQIARDVVRELGITLLQSEHKAVSVQPTENLEAYQAYLQGRYYATRPDFTAETTRLRVQSFQRAVELDSGFALAYAELSKAHSVVYNLGHDLSAERQALAQQAIERALMLEPESPQVHLALAFYYYGPLRDYERALVEYTVAEKSLPDNIQLLLGKAAVFRRLGRWQEALETFEKAFGLDPRNANMAAQTAATCLWMRKYQKAESYFDQSIALVPDQTFAYFLKATMYWSWKGKTEGARSTLELIPRESKEPYVIWSWYWQGIYDGNHQENISRLTSINDVWLTTELFKVPKSLLVAIAYDFLNDSIMATSVYDSAVELLEKEILTSPGDQRLHSALGMAYAGLGRKQEAIREGRKAVELNPIAKDAFWGSIYVTELALIQTKLGEYHAALDNIETLLSIPSLVSVPWLKLDPRWKPLMNLPRFQKLLAKYSQGNKL